MMMLGLLPMFFACKSTKLVPNGKYLLVKNNIINLDSTKDNLFKKAIKTMNDDISLYVKHKPNRKILGIFKFHLGMYQFGTSIKNPYKNTKKKWRKVFRANGEAPVLLDSNEIEKSRVNLQNYFFSKGFFNSEISYKVDYKKKKARVTYYVLPNQPFKIKDVNLFADDAEIDKTLNEQKLESFLKIGNVLELENITKERNRLTNILRNKGYIDFTKDYFDFELDTLKTSSNELIINIYAFNKNDEERFEIKTIKKVLMVFENDIKTQELSNEIVDDSIHFFLNSYPINTPILAKNITVRPGDVFSQLELENTYNKLIEFPIFKFIDIQYLPSENDSLKGLDMVINVRTGFRQSFTIEPQGLLSQLNRLQTVSTANSYGVANNITWSHRNLFRNGEQFNISSVTRAEVQAEYKNKTFTFASGSTSIQQSLNMSLLIPKSFFLNQLEFNPKVKSVRTNLNLSLLYEKNPDYSRKIIPITYQYIIKSKNTNWFLNVTEVSFSRNLLSSQINLNGRKDSVFIRQLFSSNLVTSSGLSFIYSNQNTTKSNTFFFVRSNALEFGGNIHRLVRRAIDSKKDKDTSYQLFDVNYFQYAKSEIDARCSTIIDENNSLAFRINAGIAFPYTNQKILPFDKLFFIGGSNSLRAWRPRTIGPGSFNDSNNNFRIDRAGDIIFQASGEFRFDLIDKFLELGLFVDAGNIWLSRTNANTITSKVFKKENFYKELAVNTGIGFRFDFQFFLFRLDWGWQVKNPEKPEKERLVINNLFKKRYINEYTLLNFGIGYPF